MQFFGKNLKPKIDRIRYFGLSLVCRRKAFYISIKQIKIIFIQHERTVSNGNQQRAGNRIKKIAIPQILRKSI